MSIDGGSAIAGVLAARGVRFLFTLCGGHIAPILVGARRAGIRVIDVRDEATAVFAADAVARLTGVPGVAAVTAGPGHLYADFARTAGLIALFEAEKACYELRYELDNRPAWAPIPLQGIERCIDALAAGGPRGHQT